MTLNDLLKQKKHKEIWQKYCGFIDLSLQEYMRIQTRLLMEQIELMSECELGQRLMRNRKPASIEEFRQIVPLTTYCDYEDILLKKQASALPAEPVVWIETTWEGGKSPVKLAPYSEGMLRAHRATVIATMLFATSKRKGSFALRRFDRFMHGMAPLPYLTGLIPYVLDGEVDVEFLPESDTKEPVSISRRNSLGMNQAMRHGIDLFFGIGNVLMNISEQFVKEPVRLSLRSMFQNSCGMNYRLSKAWLRKRIFKKTIFPKDIWDLKGLIHAGTDTFFLKEKLENFWGVEPLEVFGGTEPSCIAAETWSKNGLVMFPDVCLYEFIPESELVKCESNPLYVPKTSLMDELNAGVTYELVFTCFRGGAFLRYRAGYMFLCVSTENVRDGVMFPQFRYLNRLTSVIDVAGFVRVTEQTIEQVVELSKLPLANWFAVKEFTVESRPYMHLFVELDEEAYMQDIDADVIQDQLILYFRYLDLDEWDIESLFGVDPLVTTVLPRGSISAYESANGQIQRINPIAPAVAEILNGISSSLE